LSDLLQQQLNAVLAFLHGAAFKGHDFELVLDLAEGVVGFQLNLYSFIFATKPL
jgi:hypothetical protein